MRNRENWLGGGFVAVAVLALAACSSHEVRHAHTVGLVTATEEIPENTLLDVAIVEFNPGIAAEQEEVEDGVFPQVRRAEARYLSVHLRDTLQESGHWGAVRVTPVKADSVDVSVKGKIIESNGARLVVQVEVEDASGTTWFTREYAAQANDADYIDNIKAYTQKEKVKNKYTGEYEEPNEQLMRSIEEKIEIPESRKDDFRREIMNYIGALAVDGKTFDYKMNARLQKALELKIFEDQKDSIKLTSLVSNVVDKETQEKIDIVKARMIKNMGYDEESATDVLNYVASIFARGDAREVENG